MLMAAPLVKWGVEAVAPPKVLCTAFIALRHTL